MTDHTQLASDKGKERGRVREGKREVHRRKRQTDRNGENERQGARERERELICRLNSAVIPYLITHAFKQRKLCI